MAVNKLIWAGLLCCLVALAIQIFPNAAFQAGIDVNASWLAFWFGVFLIVISSLLSFNVRSNRGER